MQNYIGILIGIGGMGGGIPGNDKITNVSDNVLVTDNALMEIIEEGVFGFDIATMSEGGINFTWIFYLSGLSDSIVLSESVDVEIPVSALIFQDLTYLLLQDLTPLLLNT
jgi:hypothetical protein